MLRFTAMAMATPVVAGSWRPTRAYGQALAAAVPINLELVTVTDTSAILTWFTANLDPNTFDEFGRPEPIPADTRVELGTSPLDLQIVVDRDDETPFHYVELTGLEPGRPYFYRASSNGLTAVPTVVPLDPTLPGQFTTLTPPSGALLFTMCWANDVHIGEMTSGLAISNDALPGGGLPPGFAADPADPYWRFMAKAAVDEGKARGGELMLFAGDLTSEAEPVNLAEARAIFDRFGPYKEAYHVTRGNHDRAHSGATWDGCEPVGDGFNDCLLDAFFPDGPPYFSFDHQGVHVVGLDTNDMEGMGAIAPEQFEWLEADLDANGDRPTFVFGHHPVTQEAGLTAAPPVIFTLNEADAARLEGNVSDHNVVGVYSGHTHRNKRTSSARAPGVPFIELGAVKEYPGGYGLVKVYEGGYMVNFYKTEADPARAWSERSRGEYLGLYPYYTLGTLADRNFVVTADLSDAARNPPRSTPDPTTSGGSGAGGAGSGDSGRLPATGGSGAVVAGGIAAAAGLAAVTASRRAGGNG